MDMNETICNCMEVTVQDIANAIKGGATTFEEVVEVTGATTGCGGCEDHVKEVIAELTKEE